MKNLNLIKRIGLGIALLTSSSAYGQQNGLHFDGNGDYIQTSYQGILGNGNRTVEAWVNSSFSTSQQAVIASWGSGATGNRFTVDLHSNGKIRGEVGGSSVSSSSTVNDGTWHHIAVVYDNAAPSNTSIYIDGVLDNQGNLNNVNTISSGNNVRIGYKITNEKYFDGTLDEVRIWDVARTQTEIQNNMNDEICSVPTSLRLYYKLNHGTAGGTNTGVNIATDYSLFGEHGALNGFSLSGASSNWVTGAVVIQHAVGISLQSFSECPGFTTTVNGNVYSTTGVYTDVLSGASANGCDSIVTTDLTILTPAVLNQNFAGCAGYTVTVNGNIYSATGLYSDTLFGMAANGCDSIINTNLVVQNAVVNNLTQTECPGYSVTINGNVYNTTGVYSETIVGGSFAGCDSTINLDLTILAPVVHNITQVNCFGHATVVNGTVYSTTGVHNIVIPGGASNGCDSTVVLDLTILPQNTSILTFSECYGDSIDVNGTIYNATGTYTQTLVSAAGCDSTLTIDLTVASAVDVATTTVDHTITADNASATYQWVDCDANNAPISGETSQSFTATANGNYAVIVSEGNCSDTSACSAITTIGIDENNWTNTISIYPNPSAGIFTIDLSDSKNASVKVYSLDGKLILENPDVKTSEYTFEITENTGTYLVEITTNNSTNTYRIVKQ